MTKRTNAAIHGSGGSRPKFLESHNCFSSSLCRTLSPAQPDGRHAVPEKLYNALEFKRKQESASNIPVNKQPDSVTLFLACSRGGADRAFHDSRAPVHVGVRGGVLHTPRPYTTGALSLLEPRDTRWYITDTI